LQDGRAGFGQPEKRRSVVSCCFHPEATSSIGPVLLTRARRPEPASLLIGRLDGRQCLGMAEFEEKRAPVFGSASRSLRLRYFTGGQPPHVLIRGTAELRRDAVHPPADAR
jgi:hypothetical protein